MAQKKQMREVKVTFENDDIIHTNMAPHVTDKEIREYYKIGLQFNMGYGGKDVLTKVKDVTIIK